MRNVHIWSAGEAVGEAAEVAGFVQHGNVSVAKLRSWLALCFVVVENNRLTSDWGLFPTLPDDWGKEATSAWDVFSGNDAEIIPAGHYVVRGHGNMRSLSVFFTTSPPKKQPCSGAVSRSARSSSFRQRLKQRDGGCCVSGETFDQHGTWAPFEAAHIVSRAQLPRSQTARFADHIQDNEDVDLGASKIDSIQNGILLRCDIHNLWNQYKLSVDPDDNYKIHVFTGLGQFDGSSLRLTQPPDSPCRPLDVFLREHYKQAILANVRGDGSWDDDDHDCDINDIQLDNEHLFAFSHAGKARLEMTLGARLNHLTE